MSARVAALALLVLGVALMIPFEAWYTRVAGVLALLGFVVCGVFAVATPDYLAAEDEDEDGAGTEPAGATPPA